MVELDTEEPGVASALVNPALGKQNQLDQESSEARQHSPTGKPQVPVRDVVSKTEADDPRAMLGGCDLHMHSCVTPKSSYTLTP